LRAKKAKIDVWSADQLADVADVSKFGLNGSPTRVVRAYYALEKGRETRVVKGEEGVNMVLSVLRETGVIS
jgi:electron transfer flavoprotein alpha/beta subunit